MALDQMDGQHADVPLHVALAGLIKQRGVTLASLASILRAEGLTIGRTRLHQIATGQGPPASPAHMERLAQVLGVVPAYFAEYRLWRVRSLLDPGEVGFERAMENLGRLNGRRGAARLGGNGDSSPTGRSRYPARVSKVKEQL